MTDDTLIFKQHAVQQMILRRISEVEVREVVEHGETIETNPRALPYPSRLIAGRPGGRPIHVAVADGPGDGKTHIITVYEPDRGRWTDGFRKRR